jgi:ribosomal protein S27AE
MTRHSQGKYCSPPCRREGERASWRLYGKRERAQRRDYYAGYYKKNAERIIARTKAHQKTEAGRSAAKKAGERQRAVRPEAVFARRVVRLAVAAGILKRRRCEKCKATKTHAHHDDYSQPLRVRWLCAKHHVERHAELKKEMWAP